MQSRTIKCTRDGQHPDEPRQHRRDSDRLLLFSFLSHAPTNRAIPVALPFPAWAVIPSPRGPVPPLAVTLARATTCALNRWTIVRSATLFASPGRIRRLGPLRRTGCRLRLRRVGEQRHLRVSAPESRGAVRAAAAAALAREGEAKITDRNRVRTEVLVPFSEALDWRVCKEVSARENKPLTTMHLTIGIYFRHPPLELQRCLEVTELVFISRPAFPQGPRFIRREFTNDAFKQSTRVWNSRVSRALLIRQRKPHCSRH